MVLTDRAVARRALTVVWQRVSAALAQGQQAVTLEVRPATRSDAQNRLLHGLLQQIADRLQWAGARRDVETWKRLLTAAWMRARNEHIEMLPAIDGHGVDIVFRRTAQLTRAECAELTEFVQAWAAENGIMP